MAKKKKKNKQPEYTKEEIEQFKKRLEEQGEASKILSQPRQGIMPNIDGLNIFNFDEKVSPPTVI